MKTDGFKHLDADVCRMVVEEVTVTNEDEAATKGALMNGKEEAKWQQGKKQGGAVIMLATMEEKSVPVGTKMKEFPISPGVGDYGGTVNMSKSWDKGIDDMNAAILSDQKEAMKKSIKKSLDAEMEDTMNEVKKDFAGSKEGVAMF
jgi:hypothetical protein